MAQTVNLNMNQGETWRWPFVWASQDPASTEAVPLPPIPFDFTGCTAALQVRERYGSPVLAELSLGSGISLNAGGEIVLEFTDVVTDALGATADPSKPRSKAKYDLEITFPSGDVRRVIQGAIILGSNITREVAL